MATVDYREILQQIQNEVNVDEHNTVLVDRAHLLDSAVKAVKKLRFRNNCMISVEFAGEDAEDYGGPKREFFWYAFLGLQLYTTLHINRACQSSNCFNYSFPYYTTYTSS